MATLVHVETTHREHIEMCAARVPTAIEEPTRVHFCEVGETEEIEEFLTPVTRPVMRKVRRGCIHVSLVTHTCPTCGFVREFGGPAQPVLPHYDEVRATFRAPFYGSESPAAIAFNREERLDLEAK